MLNKLETIFTLISLFILKIIGRCITKSLAVGEWGGITSQQHILLAACDPTENGASLAELLRHKVIIFYFSKFRFGIVGH
jgi:hypothetical protein